MEWKSIPVSDNHAGASRLRQEAKDICPQNQLSVAICWVFMNTNRKRSANMKNVA